MKKLIIGLILVGLFVLPSMVQAIPGTCTHIASLTSSITNLTETLQSIKKLNPIIEEVKP